MSAMLMVVAIGFAVLGAVVFGVLRFTLGLATGGVRHPYVRRTLTGLGVLVAILVTWWVLFVMPALEAINAG